jgi:hypothetical protein
MESLGLGHCNRVSHDGEGYVLVGVLYLLSRTQEDIHCSRKVWKCREEREGAKGWTVRVWTQRGLGKYWALHSALAH